LYIEKHEKDIGFTEKSHYLSDINLDKWIYANATDDIIGKIQYRKWFITHNNKIIEENDISNVLADYDIMCTPFGLPAPSVRAQYAQYHGTVDIDLMTNIISDLIGPSECAQWVNYINRGNILIYANIYIARRKAIFAYYDWMFPLLDEFMKRSKFRERPDFYNQRAPGFIAERLFSYFFLNKGYRIFNTLQNSEESSLDKDAKLLRFKYPG
jgi:hypothetical protein